jgi:signal transduction histidine kinase
MDAGLPRLVSALRRLPARPQEDSMPESNQGRVQTDQSLRVERGKTDEELGKRRTAIERSADTVVQQARTEADEVLQTARDAADGKGNVLGAAAVLKERAMADNALEGERTIADESVRREREDRKRALSNLLRFEREETDQHLLTERDFSDEALGTRDSFLAMVSHDLRTMLGGIAMTAALLARDALTDRDNKEAVRARAATIQRLAARMNRLIGDLVDVASMEAGKLLVVRAEGDLLALVRESVEVFQPSADAHAIKLMLELQGPPLLASFDRDRLLQVMANLLSNAIKFSPRGGRVYIRAERAGGELRVEVADTGPGIRAEHLEAIFEKFWQVTRTDRRGLGLGLYISKRILEGHGGRIWAESAPGAGCKLIFALPAA